MYLFGDKMADSLSMAQKLHKLLSRIKKIKQYMEPKDEKIEENKETVDINAENEEVNPTDGNTEATEVENEVADEKAEPADKLQEMGEKLADMNDKYLRLYSDFENFRRRTSKEKTDLIISGGKKVIEALLPIVDDFERALTSLADDDPAKEGVNLIYTKLMTMLQQQGLKPIESVGQKFDLDVHEAVSQLPAADESQKNTVIAETVKGYYLNDKVLRFAKVVVAI